MINTWEIDQLVLIVGSLIFFGFFIYAYLRLKK